jgi:hypothetical protein
MRGDRGVELTGNIGRKLVWESERASRRGPNYHVTGIDSALAHNHDLPIPR